MIEKDICISEEERKEHDKQIIMQNVNTLGDERKEYDLLIARQSVTIPQGEIHHGIY